MFLRRLATTSAYTLVKVALAGLSGIFIARLLNDSAQFGQLSLALSYANVFLVFLGFGVNGALVRHSHEESARGTLQQYLRDCYSVIFFVHLVVILLAVVFYDSIGRVIFPNATTHYLLPLCCILLVTQTLQIWITSVFWGINDFNLRGICQASLPLLKVIFLLGSMVFVNQHDLNSITVLLIFAELTTTIFVITLFRRQFGFLPFAIRLKPDFQSGKFKKAVGFGFWTMLAALGMLLMTLIDRIFIDKYTETEILGKFAVLTTLISYLYLAANMVSNVALSNYLTTWESDPSKVTKALNKIWFFVTLGVTAASILLAKWGPQLIAFIYGKEYGGLSHLFPVMLLTLTLKIYYSLIGTLSAISRKPQITTYSFVGGLLANVIGNVIFTPIYGIKAVIVSTLVSYLLISVTLTILLSRQIREFSMLPLVGTCLALFIVYYVTTS